MPYDAHTKKKPEWADVYARDVDLSDVWMEEMDPENEMGEACTGFYSHDRRDDTLRLEGVAVEDCGGFRFYDREWLLRAFGEIRVWQLEQMEMESA